MAASFVSSVNIHNRFFFLSFFFFEITEPVLEVFNLFPCDSFPCRGMLDCANHSSSWELHLFAPIFGYVLGVVFPLSNATGDSRQEQQFPPKEEYVKTIAAAKTRWKRGEDHDTRAL
jgi:hypothetical protein